MFCKAGEGKNEQRTLCRGDRIRTYDPLNPSQMRYSGCATPRLISCHHIVSIYLSNVMADATMEIVEYRCTPHRTNVGLMMLYGKKRKRRKQKKKK